MRFPAMRCGLFSSEAGKCAGIVLASVAILWVTGCGMGVVAGPIAEAPRGALKGQAKGGQQPVTGAKIYLYKAGTTGYGSAATSIILSTGSNVFSDGTNYYVTTDGSGRFDLTGDYSCAAGDEIYVLALGGNPGNKTGNANSKIALMAGLGDCTFLQNNAADFSIQINELTTVASVYALQQFMVSGSAPLATNLGTSSPSGISGGLPGNATGLQAAMAMINNLVDINTGLIPGVGQPAAGGGYTALPSYETMTVPVTTMNSLGNILAGCVNSDPTNGDVACANLFAISKYGTTTPTDTVQAIFNIAQNPWSNVTALYNLQTAFVQWGNDLGAAPNDWTLPVEVNGGGISDAQYPAIDSQGNIWLPNGQANAVTKISPSGVILSGASGFASNADPYALAIDPSDNVWMVNTSPGKGSVSYMSNAGVLQSGGSPSSTKFTGCGVGADGQAISHGIAVDGNGNAWVPVYTLNTTGASSSVESINEFSGASGSTFGTCIAGPLDNGGVTTTSGPNLIAFDYSGSMWVANKGANVISRLTYQGTAPASLGTFSTGINTPFNVAIDAAGNAWTESGGGTGNLVKITSPSAVTGAGTITTYTGNASFSNPIHVMVDGLDNVWTGNYTPGCVSKFSNAGVQLSTVCLGKGTFPPNSSHGLAVDFAGNLWVGMTSTTAQGLYFLVGAAAPTVAPIQNATVNNLLGTRP